MHLALTRIRPSSCDGLAAAGPAGRPARVASTSGRQTQTRGKTVTHRVRLALSLADLPQHRFAYTQAARPVMRHAS